MSATASKIITFLKTHAKDFTDSKRCFIIVTHKGFESDKNFISS